MVINLQMFIILTTSTILGEYTDGRKGVLEEEGGERHNITEAAPKEVKHGEGG